MKLVDSLAAKFSKRAVPEFFREQPKKLETFLPYESILNRTRPFVLLHDGGLGIVWELDLIAHEATPLSELSRKLETFSKIFLTTSRFTLNFQVIYDSFPATGVEKPDWFENSTTFEQKVLKHRIHAVEKESQNTAIDDVRLMTRKLYLTARVNHVGDGKAKGSAVTAESELAATRLIELEAELETLATEIEATLMRAGIRFRFCRELDFLRLAKRAFHSTDVQKGDHFLDKPVGRLSAAVVDDFVTFCKDKIVTGDEAWQVLSLHKTPQDVFDGLVTGLLQVKQPIRVVVNLCHRDMASDLSKKEYFLRNARDAFSARQQKDVRGALESLAYGDKHVSLSLHVLVRHPAEGATPFSFESTRRAFENTLGLSFVTESYAAPLAFWSCMPLMSNGAMSQLVARDKPVLSSRVGDFLPLFSGFKGTGERLKTQLLQSRSGEHFWLSMRASDTSAHLAVLASSGAGKSFLCSNILTSERASNPSSMTFIIDKRTSYEILATVFGQVGGYQIVKPPEKFPNLFKGELDEEGERLRCIVNVLKTAISLASPGEFVDAIRTNILGLATQKTFEDAKLDSTTEFDHSTQALQVRLGTERSVPKLSEIVDNLATVCEQGGFETQHAKWLRDKLTPFFGNGPYANLFDMEEKVSFEAPTPSVSLYDLEGVSGDKILSTLTALILVSDIVRQIKRKENRGRSSQLVIDEAGVIGSESPEIATFIDDSFKTFRKLNCMGVGLTNTVSDYKQKPGPRTIWAVSPNKIILRMSQNEIDDAFKETKDFPALLHGDLTKSLVESLVKKDGVYSQGLFISQETMGTFHYRATGYDYWLAASKPEEVATVHALARELGGGQFGYENAVTYLAERYPSGVRNTETNAVRGLTDDEVKNIAKHIHTEADTCQSA